jgi:hypothetical protein
MVKRDDYNYQETRQRIANVENENKLLKMMCISLNRDFRSMRNTIVSLNANVNAKQEEKVNEKVNEKDSSGNMAIQVEKRSSKENRDVIFDNLENTLGQLKPDEIEKLLESLMEKKNTQKQVKSRKKKPEVQKKELNITFE